MWIIIFLFLAFIGYKILSKLFSAKGFVGQLLYNDDFFLKPYSQEDMQLSRDIANLGGQVQISEIIVFKWYLMRSLLGTLGIEEAYKIKTLELNQQLDKAFFTGFGTELKRFSENDLELRLRQFYLTEINLYIDIEELQNMSERDIYMSILELGIDYKGVGSLFIEGQLGISSDDKMFSLYKSKISEYLDKQVLSQRLLLKTIAHNPSMLTI